MASTTITIHLAEKEQFKRLVAFVCEVDDLARINADDELQEVVQRLRDDLLHRRGVEDER